jgi:hypothetical protein
MNASQSSSLIQALQMPTRTNSSGRLDEHMHRALNKIKRPSTAEEITETLNRNLGPGDRAFEVRQVTAWLRNASDSVLSLYWLESRPRR